MGRRVRQSKKKGKEKGGGGDGEGERGEGEERRKRRNREEQEKGEIKRGGEEKNTEARGLRGKSWMWYTSVMPAPRD